MSPGHDSYNLSLVYKELMYETNFTAVLANRHPIEGVAVLSLAKPNDAEKRYAAPVENLL